MTNDERTLMTTVDFRSRYQNDDVALDPGMFLDLVAGLPDGRTRDADRAATRLGLPPLTLDVDGEPLTFTPGGDALVVRRGADDALVVALDRHAFSDLVQDVASTFGVHMAGRAQVKEGGLDPFLEWEPVLRCLLDGRAVYEPGTVAFHDRAGGDLDLHRSFTLESDPADVGHFLSRSGLPAPRRCVHRGGDGGGVRGARRRHRGGRAGRRRVVVGAHRRRRVVPGADPRLQPEVADAARAAPQRPLPFGRVVHRRPVRASATPTWAIRRRAC